jgi:hypothetical protein
MLAHLFVGAMAYNETRALIGNPPVTVASYALSGAFWFKTMQTWEAEFIAILIFLVLTIFLREQGSADSKPVDSSNQETGKTNE